MRYVWFVGSVFATFGGLLAIVFATGSTFGQRCAKLYTEESTAWQLCVDHLSKRRN